MYHGGSYATAHANAYAASAESGSYGAGITNDQRGGADPRTLEISSDVLAKCHVTNLVITSNVDNADYILDFRRQAVSARHSLRSVA